MLLTGALVAVARWDLSIDRAAVFSVASVYCAKHDALSVSVLEDYKGFAAMRKSKDLIRGKLLIARHDIRHPQHRLRRRRGRLLRLGLRGATHGIGSGTRFLLGLMLAALCEAVMLAHVTQTVVYLVYKSYYHKSIDKANIFDHLEVYLGDYVPLKASDIQMEQFQV